MKMSLEKIIHSWKKVKRAIGIAAVSLALTYGSANAINSRYEIEKIPIPDPNDNFNVATCINEDGEVVGIYGKTDGIIRTFWRRVFLYKNKIVKDLGENYYSSPAINDLGDIVVPFRGPSPSGGRSFVYKIGEKPIELVFWGEDINNKGEVVGGIGNRIYLYSQGKTTELYDSGDGIEANAINDYTQVVGSLYGVVGAPHAFLWDRGVITFLSPKLFCAALGFNNNRKIVGYFLSSAQTDDSYACMWEKGMTGWIIRQLDTVPSRANAINDNGQIVGSSMEDSPRKPVCAFLYQNGKEFNLNDLLTENSEFMHLYSALDINNKGQIVGYGIIRGSSNTYAFLMTPVHLEGDLNNNDVVNFEDLAIFAEHWLEER